MTMHDFLTFITLKSNIKQDRGGKQGRKLTEKAECSKYVHANRQDKSFQEILKFKE